MKKEQQSSHSFQTSWKKVEITAVAQLLSAIKDGIEKIEEAQKKKDGEQLASAKREILGFQKKLSGML